MTGTTHRATQENGPSVVNGQLVWTSATGITSADVNSYGGCQRRFWYDYVGDLRGPATEAMKGGTALHSEIENHLRTGAGLTTPLALAGRMFIPHPGGNLRIEQPIHFKTKCGIDIFGHVDLYNFRQEYIAPDGALTRDPSWSFEVKDWKTTADFQYAKSERELAENIQLVTYAEGGYRFAPDMDGSRLTHVYFRTRGRPEAKLVTVFRSREQISARWEYAESVVRVMADVAREPTAETVPGNRKACDAYRGCPHRGRCSVYSFSSLDNLYNKIATDFVDERNKPVGIIAQTQPQLMQQATTQQQLAQEEATLRAQAAQQQAQMPQAFNPVDFVTMCQRLGSYGYGFPSLGGNAAQAYAAAGGQNVAPGFVFQGVMAPPGAAKSVHQLVLNEVAHVYQLEREIAAERGAPPTFAQVGVMAHGQVVQTAPIPPQYASAQNPAPVAGGILAPGTPSSMPQLAMPQTAPAQTEAPAEEPKKSRGRPKKDQGTAPETAATVAQTAPSAPSSPTSSGALATQVAPAAAPSTEPTVILINAREVGGNSRSLANYVDYINTELAKRYCVMEDGKPGVQDVRCAPKGSPLAFGGWKGAVREIVKSGAGLENVDGQVLHLDTFLDELNEAVADALRIVADQRGWRYFRAVRG